MADKTSTPRFWRSPAEHEDAAALRARHKGEFAPGVSQAPEVPEEGLSRRRFLGLLGASAALAVTAGCGRNIDRGSIVPYTRRPEDGLPGRAAWYATSTSEGCVAIPLLVKTREARPILIEGHDQHEDTRGAAPIRQQADLLGLYDPERLQGPRRGGAGIKWEEAEKALVDALGGGSSLLIAQACLSPSRKALLDRLAQNLPGLKVVHWEAAAPHSALEASSRLFGAQWLPRLHLDKAKVVLTLEADLFAGEGEVSRNIRGFADGRRLASGQDAAKMNRLWAAESRMTLTGGKADQRLRIKSSQLGALGFALARELAAHGKALPAGAALPAGDLASVAKAAGLDASLLKALAADLAAAGSAALVVAGASAPADAHAAAILLNRQLGAEGVTLEYRPAALAPLATPAEMAGIGRQLAQGAFRGLVVWDANPAYDGPAGVEWPAALAGAKVRVHIGRLPDESAAACEWSLASNHWLECWGDQAGGLLQQPVVAPLFDTRQAEDLLLGVLRGKGQDVPASFEEFLKAQWTAQHARLGSPLSFDLFWHGALHDGWVRGLPFVSASPALAGGALASLASPAMGDGLELVLHPDRRLLDGRGANIGWLQELPDPVTKCTWGNPLAVSPADAKRLGLEDGRLATLEVGGKSLTLPVLVQPGQLAGTLALALGYGRKGLAVAEGIGTDAYPLLAGGKTVQGGAKLTPATGETLVHTTQEHALMEGRDIVRSLGAAAYAAGATGAPSHGHGEGHGEKALATGHDHGLKPKEEHPLSLYPEHEYKGHKWGMVIDLTACVGCAGCVTACQAENNIPVVGPERIDEGREMQWIRIDRYYEGDLEDPDMVFQPMLCQHCDNAPCENVCPVAATTHNEEGLNQMTYNRCVGTRYCANNCPYKVRHFNYFDYTSKLSEVLQMAANPEVSIRPRGVMEKCTFCVQRINDAKNRAKAEDRPVADGDVRPACAVACAAGAITFGDLNAESEVARLSRTDRRYKVLEELGIRPAVTYLAEVRNPVATGGAHES